ncbi:MAG: serine/threonine-protein kinase [Candidatus Xenobia bacterium]
MLQLPEGTYGVRVVADDGIWWRWRGEMSDVNARYDKPTIVMQREVAWDHVVILLGTLLVLTAWVAVYFWRRTVDRTFTIRVDGNTFSPESRLALHASGRVIGSTGRVFLLEEKIGEGGMGAVYGAQADPADGSPYAVKFLLSYEDVGRVQRFEREVQICAQLHHPNITQVVDWGTWQDPRSSRSWLFMVMERVDGQTLRDLMATAPDLATELAWMAEILRGVRVAHQAGIIHRDLKPENVMFTAAGRVKIMDFGIAHNQDLVTLTRTGESLGTPLYMSPEQLDGKPTTPSSDLYSVGLIFYELVTGRPPHHATSFPELVAARMLQPTVPPSSVVPNLPAQLDAIILRLLESRVAARYQSADEVLADLAALPSTESSKSV